MLGGRANLEWELSGGIGDGGICAAGNEELNDVVAVIACGLKKYGVADVVFGVNVRAGGQKDVHGLCVVGTVCRHERSAAEGAVFVDVGAVGDESVSSGRALPSTRRREGGPAKGILGSHSVQPAAMSVSWTSEISAKDM